jgi:4-amino-4-deoxy-L-arabinose transferase-like glycosyltransferase
MAEAANYPRAVDRVSRWTLVLTVALALRVVAAFVVTWYAEAKGKLCVFGDTAIYWELARAIAAGDPYLVMQWGMPHFALRTPGYPLFLAACRGLFGPNLLAVRLVQAVLGTLVVWLVARLARSVLLSSASTDQSSSPLPLGEGPGVRGAASTEAQPGGSNEDHLTRHDPRPGPLPGGEGGRREDPHPGQVEERGRKAWLWIPLAAAVIAAVDPYVVAISALVLSEATFLPLMLLGLWGLAVLWRPTAPKRAVLVALGTGLAMGLAILSRPSWALFLPLTLTSWFIGSSRGLRQKALKGSLVVALATAVVLAPWWVRNAQVIGKFVPTALWVGASLYDGIGPQANGESDMAFVEEPDVRSLGEVEQDAVFLERSTSFAKAHPGRVLELALIKLGRFWSPWPNAGTLRGPGVAPASALVTLPVLGLIAIGAWDRRRDFRALALLAGPLVYFCVLHMVFVSSIRYRIPGEVPALALAGVGLGRFLAWVRPRISNGLSARSDFTMHLRRRTRKVLGWGAFLVVAILVGGTIAAYFYVTDSETLADLIRREAPRYLPGCRVNVMKVRFRPLWGDVGLNQVHVYEPDKDSPDLMVASAYRVTIRFDPWAMFKGRFDAREVIVSRPKIRLRRKPDGSWNVQGLLADPSPIKGGGPTPPISIQEGTIELSEDGTKGPLTLLRDVTITIPASTGLVGPIRFDLTAKGDTGLFDRVHAEGSIDPETGRVILNNGELVRLSLSEAYRDRLPAPVRDWLAQAGLAGGEVDADLASFSFDPQAAPRYRYQGTAKLRRGLWQCRKLPFTISDVNINVQARDGELTILEAHGSDGSTSLSLAGRATLNPDNPARSMFRIVAEANNLELDSRLRDWIPEETRELWDAYFPDVKSLFTSAGRINVKAVLGRSDPKAEIDVDVNVKCLDVSMKYKHFAYPVDHITGTIHATKETMELDVRTMVNDRPVKVTGTVLNPGPDAVADLTFVVDSLPIDAALFKALPPEVKPVVAAFNPTGTVKGTAKLKRLPPLTKQDDPRGRVTFDALIDLNNGCSATWEGLRYPVMIQSGRLEIHPDLWIFPEVRGKNGQALIVISGQVEQLNHNKPKGAPDAFKVDLNLQARNLPFDQQLLDALPTPWKVTWETLNPSGASDIDAEIRVDPRKSPQERQHDRIVIVPLKGTSVKLRFKPLVGAGAPPVASVELPMDDVAGMFVYDTAQVPHTSMTNVGFSFQKAPVTFAQGEVDVKDNGQFNLGVSRLEVVGLRLDEDLRKYMPPVMAQFSRKLDDVRIATIKTDLGLGWSGQANESAWCQWKDALVVLNRNKVSIGTDIGLENIQGQLDHVNGSFQHGRDLSIHGKVNLSSLDVFEQQVTDLTADLDVEDNLARLDHIKAKVLQGTLEGQVRASLEASPNYSVRVDVQKADLQAYARNLPGHQEFKGLVDAHVDLSGEGYDPHTITGNGMARIVQGDLGTLPVALRFVNALRRASLSMKETRTAFDKAEVAFRVYNGDTTLKPVRLIGNAFTLDGEGTLDVRGEIDLKLRILPGRDSLQIPVISDFTRGLSGQILVVRVHGPVGSPGVKPEPIPGPFEMGKALKRNREIKQTGLVGPWRTGLENRLRAGAAGRWFAPDDER